MAAVTAAAEAEVTAEAATADKKSRPSGQLCEILLMSKPVG